MTNYFSCKTEPKIVMIGDSLAGKTSIIIQYLKHIFGSFEPTIGASYSPTQIETSLGPITMRLWDTAGQERFRNLVPLYLRNSSAAILVIDMTSTESFEHRNEWVQIIKDANQNNCKIYIAANKIDLKNEVSFEEVEQWANHEEMKWFKTSAKDYESIKVLFQTIAEDFAEEGSTLLVPVFEPSADVQKSKFSCCK